jgi:heat shock protein HtpX
MSDRPGFIQGKLCCIAGERPSVNFMKTTFLMTAITLLFVWVGDLIGGRQGMFLFLGIAAVMNFFTYWYSDKMVLKMYRAQPVTRQEAPELYDTVESLTQRAELPMPKVCIIQSDAPNAFATGRNPQNAAVAVTSGILQILNRDELEGVLAHELGHVRNRDILLSSIVATIAGAIGLLSRAAMWGAMLGGGRNRGGNPLVMLLVMILAPLAAAVVQMAISRTREFAADRAGAEISGKPLALASALRKLEQGAKAIPLQHATEATAHQFIVNPFSGKNMRKMFSTHPSTEERITRLETIAQTM